MKKCQIEKKMVELAGVTDDRCWQYSVDYYPIIWTDDNRNELSVNLLVNLIQNILMINIIPHNQFPLMRME